MIIGVGIDVCPIERFAAKEALAKALGAPGDLHWHDAEVTVGERGRPHLQVRGSVARRAAELGVTSWHVSLSHDGGIASAVVIAEGGVEPQGRTHPVAGGAA